MPRLHLAEFVVWHLFLFRVVMPHGRRPLVRLLVVRSGSFICPAFEAIATRLKMPTVGGGATCLSPLECRRKIIWYEERGTIPFRDQILNPLTS